MGCCCARTMLPQQQRLGRSLHVQQQDMPQSGGSQKMLAGAAACQPAVGRSQHHELVVCRPLMHCTSCSPLLPDVVQQKPGTCTCGTVGACPASSLACAGPAFCDS